MYLISDIAHIIETLQHFFFTHFLKLNVLSINAVANSSAPFLSEAKPLSVMHAYVHVHICDKLLLVDSHTHTYTHPVCYLHILAIVTGAAINTRLGYLYFTTLASTFSGESLKTGWMLKGWDASGADFLRE